VSSHFNNPFNAAVAQGSSNAAKVYDLDKPLQAYPIADMSKVELPPKPEEFVPEDNAPVIADAALAAVKAELAAVKTELAKHKPVVTFLTRETNCKVVALIAPVCIDGVEYETITVWRPTAAMIDQWLNGQNATSYDLYALMCGLPIGSLEQLFSDDAQAIVEIGYGFLPLSLRQVTPSAAV
jgi:hypothetical protein